MKSTACDAVYLCPPEIIVGGTYLRQAGTSMAAPHATGLAALVLAYRPTFTNEDIRQVLRVSADDLGSSGFDVDTGAGRLNAPGALAVDSVLRVRITSPTPDESFGRGQTVAIVGTASGPDFQRYQLFYGQWPSPSEWVPLGEPSYAPVEDALLGTWSISESLPMGTYLLRLVASSSGGRQFEEVGLVTVEPPSRRLLIPPTNKDDLRISGDRIVWMDFRSDTQWEIYLYDLATDTERRLSAPHVYDQRDPGIDGDRIVWTKDGADGTSDIYLYELATGTERQISQPRFASQRLPDISGDRIVWLRLDRNPACEMSDLSCNPYLLPGTIHLYDLATDTERQIASVHAFDIEVTIDGDRVVWIYNAGIYVYDLLSETTRQLPILDFISLNGPLGIDGDRIAYAGTRDAISWNIYLYDLAAGTERTISTGFPRSDIAIDGDRIVWDDYRDANSDIYFYDLATDTERRLTAHAASQLDPDIDGDRIIWGDFRSGPFTPSIYMFDLLAPPLLGSPPAFRPIGNQAVAEGQSVTFTVEAFDLDSNPLSYRTGSLPEGARFLDQVFSWTPDFDQAGTYQVVFEVSDGQLTDSETVTITVTDVPLTLTSLTDSPDPFSPNGDGRKETTTISASFNHAATWTLKLKDALGGVIRSFTGSGTSFSQVWDGKNALGSLVADGVYRYTLSATDDGGVSALILFGSVKLDTVAPTVSGLTDSPDPFRPSLGQSTTISFRLSEQAYVTLRIYNASGTLIRTLLTRSLKPAGSQSVLWDGKNGSGVIVPAGLYTYKVWVEDRAANRASPYPSTGTVTVQ